MCGWSIPITIPNQSQVAALVAKKKRALDINIYGPLGPTYFSIWCLFTIVGVGSSILITIPNQSQVAALVAKKKQALFIFIWATGALDLHWWGQNGNTFSFLYHAPYMCKVWALSLLQFLKFKGGKEICIKPPGAPDLRFLGQNGSEFSSL